MRRSVVVLVAGLGLVVAACAEASSDSGQAGSSSPVEETATTAAASDAAWAEIDDGLAAMGPEVGLLVAEVGDDGSCVPVHEVEPSTPRPTASQFKLFVLGALADAVADGGVSWDQALVVDDSVRSLGNSQESGSVQFAPTGSEVTVEEAATKMISISDNTATDMLIALVGRDAVEAQMGEWSDHAEANDPFLTTRQMFLLHYAAGVGDEYLATPAEGREDFLAESVDPLPLGAIGSGYTEEPRFIDEIEWFASPADVCRAFAGLQELATQPDLSPLPTILSQEVAGIGLDGSDWPTVWYKGGSEPGVLTLGWLATDSDGETYVVEAMVSNPDEALAPEAITDLVALAQRSFALLP